MKKNVNLDVPKLSPTRLPDGKILGLPIDTFPVSNKGNYKLNGFPRSDIGILERLSSDLTEDKSLVEQVAVRLQEIKDIPKNDKSDYELIRIMRPASCQTASEISRFAESIYQMMEADVAEAVLASNGVSSDGKSDSSASVVPAVDSVGSNSD